MQSHGIPALNDDEIEMEISVDPLGKSIFF